MTAMGSKQLERKATVVPLHYWNHNDAIIKPVSLMDDVAVEDSSRLLSPENFDLWSEQISQRERDVLGSTGVGLVHRFRSDFVQGEDEQKSRDLLHRLFVCCRIVKPTRSRFTAIQVRWTGESEVDVFHFTHPHLHTANAPDSEVLNVFTREDIAEVTMLIGRFLEVVDGDEPYAIRRAIRCYEQGYSETTDPVLQLLLWAMGIEAFVAWKASASVMDVRESLDEQVIRWISPDTDIYGQTSKSHYEPWPKLPVGDVVQDLFALRDQFVHGKWVPDEWKKHYRNSVAGESLSYSDVLREAASFILRNLIQKGLRSIPAE